MSADGDDDRRRKAVATERLLKNYCDRFVKDEDFEKYASLIQDATGTSDDVINHALAYRLDKVYNDGSNNSNMGRPTGGKGGGPGGNRFHADFVNPDLGRKNRRLTTQSNEDTTESGAPRDRGEEEARETQRKADEQRRLKEEHQALLKYANSFKNGSIIIDPTADDENIDSGMDVEEDYCIFDSLDEEGGGATNSSTSNRGRSSNAYQPQAGSAVKTYLDTIVMKVKHNNDPLGLKDGAAWVPPPINPLSNSLGSEADPDIFYRSNTWVYVWHPMVQFESWMPKKFECIVCKSRDNTTNNGWIYRPFHWWDKTVYILHQQIKCTACNKCFPSVSPRCLATLPTPIAEQFPFMLPNLRGPGIYSPMVFLLTLLMPHSILFGTFVGVFNSIRSIIFAQNHIAYLDSVKDWLDNPPALVSSRVPKAFSPRLDQHGYCGLNLNVDLIKSCLRLFMKVHEPYMQAAFQLACDEGASSDDSYKLNKHVFVTVDGKRVKLFAGVYSVIGLNGKPNISVFTYGKSPQELNELISNWSEVRDNVGQHELLRLEGDNAAGDSAQQHAANPSLFKNVVPYQAPAELPRYNITADDYTYVYKRDGLKVFSLDLMDHVNQMIKDTGTLRIGLDTEFDNTGVTLITLAFDGYPKALAIHPYLWGNTFESNMKTILELDGVLIIGCNVVGDLHKLRRRFGIRCKRVRDNRRYCLLDNRSQKRGLPDLTKEYLRIHVDKTYQRANFNVKPILPVHLQEYGVLDAILPLKVDDGITSRLISAGTDLGQHPPDLQPGAPIIIRVGGKDAAEAKLRFLGECGSDSGESQMWGSIYVGTGKALVKITSVIAPGLYLPFQQSSWGPDRLTFGSVFDVAPDGIIAVRARQIHRHATTSTTTATTPTTTTTTTAITPATTTTTHPAATIAANVPPNATAPTASTTAPSTSSTDPTTTAETAPTTATTAPANAPSEASESTAHETDPCIELVDDCYPAHNEDAGESDEIRSREKSDMWHEYDGLTKLLKRNSPATPFMHRLIRAAVLAINEREEHNVQSVLASKGIVDFHEHFFFNKEYWYERVRMPPRKGDAASENLLGVLHYFKTSEAFSKFITPDIEKYLKGWARRCRDGRYDDLPDVEMYDYKGKDSDGLDTWIRRRGSKAENLHQKMNVAVGPFGIGVETAHSLQVILAYQYLIHAGVNRCGEPDFGHTHHHLEDRIQTRISEIFGVDLFPNRINVSEFKPLDFTSVGVVPLCWDEDYVEKGPPSEKLNGDLRWLAAQIGLKYPLIPPSTKAEFQMIRIFCSNHPSPSTAEIQDLCKTFKALSNGVDIFPKLPSMIQPAISRWKINQAIALLKLQAGQSYDEFLEKLNREKASLPSPERRIRRGIQHKQSYRKAQSEHDGIANDDDEQAHLPQLPPVHVPPVNAPTQNTTIPRANEMSKDRCVFWPICEITGCGGVDKNNCETFGKEGSREPPAVDEVILQKRLCTWSNKAKNQYCAWACCGKAVYCGELTRDSCSKYGANGTQVDLRPSEDELKIMKKARRAAEKRAQREQKKRRSTL